MGYHIINDNNDIVGWTAEAFEPAKGQRLIDDTEQPTKSTEATDATKLKLTDVKADKIRQIKATAASMLAATDWRLQRAIEREKLGSMRPDDETSMQVYAEREAIRRASNRAEDDIDKTDRIDDVLNHVFEVKTSDYPTEVALTHLQFLRRFSVEERTKIASLRAKNQAIDDHMNLLSLAKIINISDPDVILGVNMLEKAGIIAKGRAGQILNPNTPSAALPKD